MRQNLSHAIADAGACGQFDTFEMDHVADDVTTIRGMLDTLLTALRQAHPEDLDDAE